MKYVLLFLVLLLFLSVAAIGQRSGSDPDLDANARAIHKRLLAVDMHTDVLLPETNDYYFLPGRQSRTDVDKLKRGGMGALAIAIAVHQGPRTPDGYAHAKAEAQEKLAVLRRFLSDNAKNVELARSVAEVERIRKAGKVAIIASFVNAYSIGTDISEIDELYKNGVRLFALVHGGNNDWADGSRPAEGKFEHNGLSDLGKRAIAKLNRLGVIVDVSQMSDQATLQAIKLSKAPVIASHSSVRAIVDKPRNLSDEELDAIKANDGVVGITVWNGYVANVHSLSPDIKGKLESIRVKYGFPAEFPGTDFAYGVEGHLPEVPYYKFYGESVAVYPKANIKDVVDHIDYIVKRIGIDHVGIGSDFNHGSGVEGFNDESEAPNITKELLRRGYTEDQIAKIWGGNFMRVWRDVEKVRDGMRPNGYLPPLVEGVVTDKLGRVIAVPEKQQVPCPRQTKRTAVILTFGQSNSANFATQGYKSEYGNRVLNLFEGKCYIASSPLLGANGTWGESWTLLGNQLIQNGLFENVVIVATGIGGSKVERWEKGGDLNPLLMDTVFRSLKAKYKFTHLLWHQGEADRATDAEAYTQSFQSMLGTLRDEGVKAPIFVSVVSGGVGTKEWNADAPVRQAQRNLPYPVKGIFAGVDTDVLIHRDDRYRGHFNKTGQEKFANAWLVIIREHSSLGKKAVASKH